MTIIITDTNALDYIDRVAIIPGLYRDDSLYLAIVEPENFELYTDLTTNIMPVLPGQFFVKTGGECERFVQEQKTLFTALDTTVKQGFNTYALYQYNREIY